jgi:hypothetical protein
MKFCVLNCSEPFIISNESDEYVDYRSGRETYCSDTKMLKKCISWHSIPASFETEFFVYKKNNWIKSYSYDVVLILIKNHIDEIVPVVKKFKAMGKKVGIGFHENGNYFSTLASNPNFLSQFKDLCELADFYWNLNMRHGDFFKSLLNIPVFNAFHAAPYEWKHGFTVSFENRKDIMIMTRNIASVSLKRNTIYALGIANLVAEEKGCNVTYLTEDSEELRAQRWVNSLGFERIKVIQGPLDYAEWLKLIARHKVGFHLDSSETLGQVVTDGAMVGVPVVCGDTENNYILKTDSSPGQAREMLARCYEDDINSQLVDYSIPIYKGVTSFDSLKELHLNMFKSLGVIK